MTPGKKLSKNFKSIKPSMGLGDRTGHKAIKLALVKRGRNRSPLHPPDGWLGSGLAPRGLVVETNVDKRTSNPAENFYEFT